MAHPKNFLIVEDDELTRDFLADLCQEAAKKLRKAGVDLELQIHYAAQYDKAIDILKTNAIDFVSLDLNLESNGSQDARKADHKPVPGGMQILDDLQSMKNHPVALVMSAETELSYGLDALQKYGVFAYFRKSKDESKFLPSVLAILWYLEANALVATMEANANYSSLEQAERYWENAKSFIPEIGLVKFPTDLDSIFENIKGKKDPIAPVPGMTWSVSELKERVVNKDGWILTKFWTENYKDFVTSQGFQSDQLLAYIVTVAKQTFNDLRFHDAYVGIWRHEDVIGPGVVAILIGDISLARQAAEKTVEEVNAKTRTFLNILDDQAPTPVVKYMLWDSSHNKDDFRDWHQLIDVLSKSFD